MEKLDVVYIAPDIGSLFGAVSLAAGGLKALVLQEDYTPRSLKADDGAELTPPAEPFLWRGLRPGVFLEPLLNRLKLLINARDKVVRIDPPVQIVTPDSRLDYFGVDYRLIRELVREFGKEDTNNIYGLLSQLTELASKTYDLIGSAAFPKVPMGIFSRIFRRSADCSEELEEIRRDSFMEVLDGAGLSDSGRMVLCGVIAALGLPADGNLPASAAAVMLDSARRGLHRADCHALKQMLISTFKKRGGYTMPLGELEGIKLDQSGISALRMSKSNYLQSRIYVAAENDIARFMPDQPTSPDRITTRIHALTVLARKGAVPVGMKDRVVIVGHRAEPLYPEHVTRIRVNRITSKNVVDYVLFTVESLRTKGVESTESELWEALRSIVPFIDDFIVSSRYDVDDSTARDYARKAYLELPAIGMASNLIPREGDLLAEMGVGEGVVSGRVLARVILKKLGLRTEL